MPTWAKYAVIGCSLGIVVWCHNKLQADRVISLYGGSVKALKMGME